MMNIVVPMAGRGHRFVAAGYPQPKPFIPVKNETMIQRVIENLALAEPVTWIFICLQDFLSKHGAEFDILVEKLPHKLIAVNQVTEGAACTVLLAKNLINTDEPLIIANCDQLVADPQYMQASIDYYREQNAAGGILCFLNSNPKWSYVKLDGGVVSQVVEKQVVSNLATVGIYYFAEGRHFVNAAEEMIRHNDRVNGEFYVAPAYNYMIISGMRIVPYMVNAMHGLGIPEDLEIFLRSRYCASLPTRCVYQRVVCR